MAEAAVHWQPNTFHLEYRMLLVKKARCGATAQGGVFATRYRDHVTCTRCKRAVAKSTKAIELAYAS